MDNRKYLQQLGVPSEAQQKCLDAMAKYDENHWWDHVDPPKLAYYQMHEGLLLTDFSHFHESLELLLGVLSLRTKWVLVPTTYDKRHRGHGYIK